LQVRALPGAKQVSEPIGRRYGNKKTKTKKICYPFLKSYSPNFRTGADNAARFRFALRGPDALKIGEAIQR
jgi:hypothetical protein